MWTWKAVLAVETPGTYNSLKIKTKFITEELIMFYTPVTGGHRREACFLPEVRAKFQGNEGVIDAWPMEIISADVWNDLDCEMILKAFSYFDNVSETDKFRVLSSDVERLLIIQDLFESKPEKYGNWTSDYDSTIILLQIDMV